MTCDISRKPLSYISGVEITTPKDVEKEKLFDDFEEKTYPEKTLSDDKNIKEMMRSWLGRDQSSKDITKKNIPKIEKRWFYKTEGRWGPRTQTPCHKEKSLNIHLTAGYEIYQKDLRAFIYKISTGVNSHRYENWVINYVQMTMKSSDYIDGDLDGLYTISYDDEKNYSVEWDDKFKYNKSSFNNVEKSLMLPIDKKTPYISTTLEESSDEFKAVQKFIKYHKNPISNIKIVVKTIKSILHPKIARMYAFEKEIMNNDQEGILFHSSLGQEDTVLSGGLDMRYSQSNTCGSAVYMTDSVDACQFIHPSQNKFYISRCLLGNIEEIKIASNRVKPSLNFHSVQYNEEHPNGSMFEKTNTFCLYSNSQTFITHVVDYSVVATDKD